MVYWGDTEKLKMKNKKEQKVKDESTEKFTEEDFYDDCPICQAMKEAEKEKRELSSGELKKAFTQAKEKGGIVGGEWFDEPK